MERNKIADYLDGNFGHLFKQTFSKIAGSSFLSVRSLLLMDCWLDKQYEEIIFFLLYFWDLIKTLIK